MSRQDEPEVDTIVVFSKERTLCLAFKAQEDGEPQVMEFNHYLERINAPFRVYLTDDEEIFSSLNPPLNVGLDYIVPHDEE